MAAPSLMFEHGLDVAKGWFQPAALDFAAPLSENVEFVTPRGRVVHVNNSGEFEMGVDTTEMAIFTLNGSEDFDVSNPGTTPTGNFMHQAIAPKGIMSGLVATGAYEIESTEFDDSRTYAANETLTAGSDNADIDVGGILTNVAAVLYVDAVCGVVSRGRFENAHGVPVLAFWPVYIPVVT